MSNDEHHEPSDIAEEESAVETTEPEGGDVDRQPAEGDLVEDGMYELDANDLVGPGKYPLRIQPAAAIMPGTADSKRLLTIWFVRKSFYWLFFLGGAIAVVVEAAQSEGGDLDLEQELSWPWAVLITALVVRFLSGWIALGLAMPLALAHEPNLSPRTNFGSGIGKFFDRLHLARAFRSLRWTHHVRQVAQRRLGERGRRLGKLDPIFDIINISSGVVLGISIIGAAVALAN